MPDNDWGVQMADRNSNRIAPFLRSKTAMPFLVFLAIIVFLLVTERRAHIFASNGFLALLLLICIGAHFFMHESRRRYVNSAMRIEIHGTCPGIHSRYSPLGLEGRNVTWVGESQHWISIFLPRSLHLGGRRVAKCSSRFGFVQFVNTEADLP